MAKTTNKNCSVALNISLTALISSFEKQSSLHADDFK